MQVFIQKNGAQTGPFPLDHVLAGLADGTYQPGDMAWYEGAPTWLPLSAVPGIGGNPPALGGGGASRTSRLAIWSLVLGILTFITAGLTALPAVICGHLALGKIKRSAGTRTGGGFAIAGLVTGYLGFAILGIAVLAGLAAPMVIRQRKKADKTEAISNARQIGLALFEFEAEYGSFPDDANAAKIASENNTPPVTGKSANARFRQLFRANFTQSENMFYAHIPGVHHPDGLVDGEQALAKGECAFAYIEPAAGAAAPRPLAMTPLRPDGKSFDPAPFANKAIILWSDNSVRSLFIDRETGHAMLDGRDILDPAHPVWGGKPPVIALPE